MEIQNVNQQLSLIELLKRSPCSIAVLLTTLLSRILFSNGIITEDELFTLPVITVIVMVICAIALLARKI